jgi:hypothetical protein
MDAFRQQVYKNSEMRKIMFELKQGEPMAIWVHALVKDSDLMFEGWELCMKHTQLVFDETLDLKEILFCKDFPDQFKFLKQEGNWHQLVQTLNQ